MPRGHGWSKAGTKKSRRLKRERSKRKSFYAVAVGRRPGIYELWKNDKPQVLNYSGAVHKRFDTLKEAQLFMIQNRIIPPGVTTPFPSAKDTPLPPPHLNPEYDFNAETVESKPVNTNTHPQMSPFIQVAPLDVNEWEFVHVRRMSERIARDEANRILDPPSFECDSKSCGYCTGDPWLQRFLLMKRLYQLNSMLDGQSEHRDVKQDTNQRG